jgi:hypothetical protein
VGGLPLYLPRDVFLTFAVFFAATFTVSPSGVTAAAALSFCFLVDIQVLPRLEASSPTRTSIGRALLLPLCWGRTFRCANR